MLFLQCNKTDSIHRFIIIIVIALLGFQEVFIWYIIIQRRAQGFAMGVREAQQKVLTPPHPLQ